MQFDPSEPVGPIELLTQSSRPVHSPVWFYNLDSRLDYDREIDVWTNCI